MTLAQQLLDAQVQWILDQLEGDRLAEVVATDVDTLLAIDLPISALVDAAEVRRVARRLVAEVPASPGAATLVERSGRILHEGREERFAAGEVLEREQVEALIDAVLHGSRVAEKVLDELAQSPLVATVASRFVGRLVGEVLAANKAAASKVPGLGGLVSLGTGAASRMMGAADKQFEALLGGGASFAARRLNKVVLETLRDPTTREALLQVWDTWADTPLPPPSALVSEEDALGLAGVLHAAVVAGAGSGPVGDLVEALVDGFFTEYGDATPADLLADLEIGREQVVADVVAFVGGAAAGLRESGQLEDVVRRRLEPFWDSPAAAALLPT